MPVDLDFLTGGDELGALVRDLDWAKTPLGPISKWPQSLKTSVSTCLNSRFPMLIWWGPELVKIYNDAYRPLIGSKHPWALGSPGREVWPEIWSVIGPMLNQVMERGEATVSEDLLLLLERDGYGEECYSAFPTAQFETSRVGLAESSLLSLKPPNGSSAHAVCTLCVTWHPFSGRRRVTPTMRVSPR